MKILLHCSESPGSIGYDICFFINNPTARSITQRVLILLLITISVFLFCFNVYLVLPYLYPDKFTDNLPDSAKSFFRDNVAKARFDNLDEEHIRAIMQNMELDDNSVANKTKRFNELVEQEEDESEPMLEYSQRKYYPLQLNPNKLCKHPIDGSAEKVYLLLVIKSVTASFERRKAIRQTWGDTHKLHLHLEETGYSNKGLKLSGTKNSQPLTIKRIFLLAKQDLTDRRNVMHQDLLEREAEEYQDILQGDFQDSFRNLTLKDIMFLGWQQIYCPKVQFIFKGDDDVFVNIFNVMRYVESQNITVQRSMFTGSVLYPSPRITNPKSKYYVSSNLWPEKYYPPYVSGGGFIMSSFVARQIFEAAKILPIIPIDDAFVGICLQKLGVAPINHKGFKSWGVSRGDRDICVFRDVMTLHKLSPDEMRQKWKMLIDSFKDLPQQCSQHFKFNL